jgi:hypothetical protein
VQQALLAVEKRAQTARCCVLRFRARQRTSQLRFGGGVQRKRSTSSSAFADATPSVVQKHQPALQRVTRQPTAKPLFACWRSVA